MTIEQEKERLSVYQALEKLQRVKIAYLKWKHPADLERFNTLARAVNPRIRALRVSAPVVGDWVEWSGGFCPVQETKMVVVQFRDGTLGVSIALDFSWSKYESPRDIIRYRVVK